MNEPKNKGGVSHKGSPTPSAKPAPKQPKQKKVSQAPPPSAKTPLKRTTPRVKKSPVKAVVNDDEEIDEVLCLYEKRCEHNDEERESCECQVFVCVDCPCGDWSVADRKSIQCPACCHWFHHDCVGLDGLLKDDVAKLKNWACYPCWSKTSPIAPSMTVLEVLPEGEEIPELDKREKGESTLDDIMEEMSVLKGQLKELKMMSAGKGRGPSDCNTLRVMMKEVMHSEQVPVITALVKEEVQKGVKAMSGNVKEQVDTKTKLWTDLFSKKAALDKDMVGDLIKKGNEESNQKTSMAISDEGYKKNERRKNIIIRGVPESKSTDNAERYDHDVKFLIEQADIIKTDIVRCFRVGSRDPVNRKDRVENGKSPHRALIIELPTEDRVRTLTNDGSGFRFETEDSDGESVTYWINKDLTPAEQLAGFRARKARSKKD